MNNKHYIVVLDNEDALEKEAFIERMTVISFANPHEAPTIYGQGPGMVGVECIARVAGYIRKFPQVLMVLQDRPPTRDYESGAERVEEVVQRWESEQGDLNSSFSCLSALGLQLQMSRYIEGDFEVGTDKYNVGQLCVDMGITRREMHEIILVSTSDMWDGRFIQLTDHYVLEKVRQMIMIWHEVLCFFDNYEQARSWMRTPNPYYELGTTPVDLIVSDRMYEAYCLAICLNESQAI